MNEKQVLIVTIAALVLVVLLGGAAVWWFQFNVLAEKKQQLEGLKTELNGALAKVAQIEGLKKDIAKAEAEIAQKQERIPNLDRAEYDKFANLLDEKRRRAGVFVPQARWATPTAAQPVPGRPGRGVPATMHKVQYDVTVKGGFYQLLKYVNLLEEERRFINVETFSIQPAGGSSSSTGGVNLLRDMKLVLYSYTYRPAEKPPLPKVDAQRAGISTPIPE
jgi:Tfp pilus assembly protein PilO